MALTRKEKQLLIFLLTLALGTALVTRIFNIPILILNAWLHAHEPQILLAFLPLGFYLVFNKERTPHSPDN